MEAIMEFNIENLNKRDREVYEKMTPSEKERFEHTWLMMEQQKLRLTQYMNASKERNQREKKVQAEKERKERTHRLIERGAMLEASIKDPEDFSNEDIQHILKSVMSTRTVVDYIEKMRFKKPSAP
jgi:hypothetical protein